MKKIFLLLSLLFLSSFVLSHSFAQSKAKKQLPYLGPGSDKLSPEKYKQVYSRYIRESITMGFPPAKCSYEPCKKGLEHLFRMAGLFSYPVPAGAQITSYIHPRKTLECYHSGGAVAQVVRAKGGELINAMVVHAAHPKALKRIVAVCKKKPLALEKDKITSLERLEGIPVGYPHPLLCPSSQGLFVRELKFNRSRNSCEPIVYNDNSWTGGFNLNEQRCVESKGDIDLVWKRRITPAKFAEKERERQIKMAMDSARARGQNPFQAKKILKDVFKGPMGNDVSVVGIAMRNIEACNLLGIGDGPSKASSGGTRKGTKGKGTAR